MDETFELRQWLISELGVKPYHIEKNYDDGGVEDASEVVVVNRVTVDDVLKILNAMLD